MTFRKYALATTALTMIGTGAWADDNAARLDQIGSANVASITQSGDGNAAGSPTRIVTQDGDNNELTFLQSGDDNRIGSTTSGGAPGIDQMGDRNSLTVTQSSDTNYLNVVQQTGAAGATQTTNTISVTQESTEPYAGGRGGNVISRIIQNNTGDGNTAADANAVTISQNRTSHSGPGNGWGANVIGGQTGGNLSDRSARVRDGVSQDGTGNEVDLSQTGYRNSILAVSQTGADNDATVSQTNQGGQTNNYNRVETVSQDSTAAASGNSAFITQNGERNGINGLSSAFAGAVGATSSSVLQTGGANVVDYSATGNDNQFGFTQIGNSNTVNQVTIVGNGNQTAAYQEGDFNSASIAPIVGDGNDVGISQTGGNFNAAAVQLTNGSDDNSIGIDQTGDVNGATVTADGDRNYVEVVQIGSNPSGVLLNIIGDDNGGGLFMGTASSSLGLASGLIKQDGFDNIFEGQIIGSDNQFAALQQGNDNEIQADVFGSENEYAVSQIGNGNLSHIMQSGNGNVAGVSQ